MIDKINADIKAAMLTGDKQTANTLRMLKNAIANARIAKKGDLDEAEELRVVQKEAKQRKESIESFKAAGRDELAQAESEELAIIERYLPQQMSNEELEQIIEAAIKESGATSVAEMGQVMRLVQPQLAGRADGGEVAALVRTRLQ